jgi:hypothetical protein
MSSLKKVVKVYLPNNEIRRFPINNKSFLDFTSLLKSQEDISDIQTLMYQMDEKWVPFGSEQEWKSALDLDAGILRIKVQCSIKTQPPSSPVGRKSSRTSNLPTDFFSFPTMGNFGNFVV